MPVTFKYDDPTLEGLTGVDLLLEMAHFEVGHVTRDGERLMNCDIRISRVAFPLSTPHVEALTQTTVRVTVDGEEVPPRGIVIHMKRREPGGRGQAVN